MSPWRIMIITIAAIGLGLLFYANVMAGPLPKPKPIICKTPDWMVVMNYRRLAEKRLGRQIKASGELAKTIIHAIGIISPKSKLAGGTIYAFEMASQISVRGGKTISAGTVLYTVVKDHCSVGGGTISQQDWHLALMRVGSA